MYGYAASLAVWGKRDCSTGPGRLASEGSKLISLQGGQRPHFGTQPGPCPRRGPRRSLSRPRGKRKSSRWAIRGSSPTRWPMALNLARAIARERGSAVARVAGENCHRCQSILRTDGVAVLTGLRRCDQTPLVWRAEDNVPDITSPVSNGELASTVTSGGM